MEDINIADYDYDLPENRIAQYPVSERDNSRMLLFDGQNISSDVFRNIDRYIPKDSLLVFNNTRVIRARLLFQKPSGANIEVFCLEPLSPAVYESSFSSKSPVEWKCIIGNLKKWKTGVLSLRFMLNNEEHDLIAEKVSSDGEAWRIRFGWNNDDLSFGEVIQASGHTPLPPYITREDSNEDSERYQTIYSVVKGSVAAPTAGLHFTEYVLDRLTEKGIRKTDITLHVGAGTFQPVRARQISDHDMHLEHFFVTIDTIYDLIENQGRIIAVGTTSVRTLESLYWLGVRVKIKSKSKNGLAWDTINQWEPYNYDNDHNIPMKDSMATLADYMVKNKMTVLNASTRLMIIPGYKFRMINGIITNFHQPRSTLLLLISAWTGNSWLDIYKYALDNGFRFLSYGDSSLLFNSFNKTRIKGEAEKDRICFDNTMKFC
jgi:S-adenosylmethionine:tRNA ribosyltransferase-isomerase